MRYPSVAQTRVYKIPDLRLDPDWGHAHPEVANAFMVSVTPRFMPMYRFVLLMPDVADVAKLIILVLKEFLEQDDRFAYRDFEECDLTAYTSSPSPVLGFDPEPLDIDNYLFGWVTPPMHLWH
jgi:hypothetical protein